MKREVAKGIMAGIMISIGCAVYLMCDNKYVGALLFSVALMSICVMGYSLYTGKVFAMRSINDVYALSLCLAGNIVGTAIACIGLAIAIPQLADKACVVMDVKMEQSFIEKLIRGVFCEILIYIAVMVWKKRNSLIGVFVCVPVFILMGAEHSIADWGYMVLCGFSHNFTHGKDLWAYFVPVLLGNTLGGVIGYIKLDKE